MIPYRGDAPAITAVLGGDVQAYFGAASTILPHVKTGRLRALAVTSKDRFAALPDLPTLAQAGVPNYDATAWYGLYAPAGTPQDVIARLNGQINAILQQPDVRKALLGDGGVDIIGGGPEVLKTQTDNEIVRWRRSSGRPTFRRNEAGPDDRPGCRVRAGTAIQHGFESFVRRR
ncbi:MAG: hypothetical protein IPH51_03820 [Rubrivivax sp.]|nr:hypothetical protein [Rubrivivax sp.]